MLVPLISFIIQKISDINLFIEEFKKDITKKFGYLQLFKKEEETIKKILSKIIHYSQNFNLLQDNLNEFTFKSNLFYRVRANKVYIETFDSICGIDEDLIFKCAKENFNYFIGEIINDKDIMNSVPKIFTVDDERRKKFQKNQIIEKVLNKTKTDIQKNVRFTTRYELIYILFIKAALDMSTEAKSKLEFINLKLFECNFSKLNYKNPIDHLYIKSIEMEKPLKYFYGVKPSVEQYNTKTL